jgi:2-haloalkanoic acid dehalogenase type II
MLLTFDCYGTLVDWETGILTALRTAYPESRRIGDERLGAEFHSIQNRLKTDRYRTYRTLLTETSAELASVRGWDDSPALAASIPASIPWWRPFTDTNPSLRRLRDAGAELGILSNIDDDLLQGTLEHFEVPFDRLGTAQRLRSYKPARPHFALGAAWAEETGRPWIHIAQSLFHDVVPATGSGIRTVWVNRRCEDLPEDATPVYVARDLTDAADWIVEGLRT